MNAFLPKLKDKNAKLKAIGAFAENALMMQELRRGMARFTSAAQVYALNRWYRFARARKAKEEKMRAAVARMSPEGRAMLKVALTLLPTLSPTLTAHAARGL